MTEKINVLIVHPSIGMRMCMKAHMHAHAHTHFYFNSILERNTMVTVTELNNNRNLHNLLATSVLNYFFNV